MELAFSDGELFFKRVKILDGLGSDGKHFWRHLRLEGISEGFSGNLGLVLGIVEQRRSLLNKGHVGTIVFFDIAPAQRTMGRHSIRRRPGSHLLLARARLKSTHPVIFLFFVNDFCAEIIVFNLLFFQFVIFVFGQMLLRDLEVCLLVVIEVIVEAGVFFENPIFHTDLILFVIVDCIRWSCKVSLAGLLSQDLVSLQKLTLLLGPARHCPIQLFGASLVVFAQFFCDLFVLLFLVGFMLGVLVVTRLQVATTRVLVPSIEILASWSVEPSRVAAHRLVMHFNLRLPH